MELSEEDEGYSSDKGTNLLSKTWSKDEREKQINDCNNVGNSKKLDKRKKGGQKGSDSSNRKKLFDTPATNNDSPRRSSRRTTGEWQSVPGEE
jgi:hypothetical protein